MTSRSFTYSSSVYQTHRHSMPRWLPKIMGKYGCPSKVITMARQFHDGLIAHVLDDGTFSTPFPVTNGVKQGCVLAPTLFSMVFTDMLSDAFNDFGFGINLTYRTDAGYVTWGSFKPTPKHRQQLSVTSCLPITALSVPALPEPDMQRSMDHFSKTCDNVDLIINIKTALSNPPTWS